MGIAAIKAFFNAHKTLTKCLKWGGGVGTVALAGGGTWYFTQKAADKKLAATTADYNGRLDQITQDKDSIQSDYDRTKQALDGANGNLTSLRDAENKRLGRLAVSDLLLRSGISQDSLQAYCDSIDKKHKTLKYASKEFIDICQNDTAFAKDSTLNAIFSRRYTNEGAPTMYRYKNVNGVRHTFTKSLGALEYETWKDSIGSYRVQNGDTTFVAKRAN